MLFAGVTNIGEVILARDVLGAGGSGLAALVAAHGVGTVLGSMAARFEQAFQWRRAYVAGLACMAVDLLLCAISPSLWLLLPVFVLGGFGNGFALVHDRLLLGASVADELHGRVFALQKALTSFAFAGSFVAASVLISAGGVQLTFAIAAAGMACVVAASAPRLRAAWPAPVTADLTPAEARYRPGLAGEPELPPSRLDRRHGEIAQLVEHTTENRGVPGSSPGLATRKPAYLRDLLLLGPVGEAINGYSIGHQGPVYFELETESPVLISVRGLLETK